MLIFVYVGKVSGLKAAIKAAIEAEKKAQEQLSS